jgi:prephenate dehydrogenase
MPKEPLFNSVTIVGVGLIGGSIGLAARARGVARRVIGVGRREAALDVALTRGAVDEVTTDLAAGVQDADLVIVATPVGKIVDAARGVAALRPDTLTTDVGSTKAEIVRALAGLRFVGSHPLAGDHHNGCQHARADLLEGRLVFVTPTEHATPEDVSRITSLWMELGAQVHAVLADEHDEIVAAISHAPHLAAAALAVTTPLELLKVTGPGWQDSTRVAAGDPQLWLEIASSNRPNIVRQLGLLEHTIAEIRRALEHKQDAALLEILVEAKQKRDAVGS